MKLFKVKIYVALNCLILWEEQHGLYNLIVRWVTRRGSKSVYITCIAKWAEFPDILIIDCILSRIDKIKIIIMFICNISVWFNCKSNSTAVPL